MTGSDKNPPEESEPDTAPDPPRLKAGHAIFLNGIQSSGKTSVAKEINDRTSTFRVFTGDDVIKRIPPRQRIASAEDLFSMTLSLIEEWLGSSNVIVEGAWIQAQVEKARNRFGPAGLYAVLRIDEAERERRASTRTDRDPRLTYPWDPAWHGMPGPDSLYDLAIDAVVLSPPESADRILRECAKRWGDALL